VFALVLAAMVSLSDGLNSGLRTAACILVGGQWDWMARFLDWGNPEFLQDYARMTRAWVCGDDIDDVPPLPDPPFTGGQCPWVGYQARWRNNRSGLNQSIGGLVGPITGYQLTVKGAFRYLVITHNGPNAEFIYDSASNTDLGISDFRVVRNDAQPDTCGSLPPVIGPPAPVNIDIDITYGPNNEFTIIAPVIFAPVNVSLDGKIITNIEVELFPDFKLEGTLELFPDFEFTPTLNLPDFIINPDSRNPGDDPELPPDTPEGDGEQDDPSPDTESESDSRVYALLCRAVIESEARPSGIYQEVGPDIYAPRLGSARFGTDIDGVAFWSEDIDIKGLNSVIQCPIPWGATRYVVNAAPGVAINYTRISTAPRDWPPFIELGNSILSDNR